MRQITITQFNFEPDIKTFVGQIMAVIELDAAGVHRIDGSAHYLEIPVTDRVDGRWITAREDPMRWSELLSETIGYGDVEVVVEELAAPERAPATLTPDATATEALAALVHQH